MSLVSPAKNWHMRMPNSSSIWIGTAVISAIAIGIFLVLVRGGLDNLSALLGATILTATILTSLLNAQHEWR